MINRNVKSDLDNWYLKTWGSKEYRQIGKLCMKYDPTQQQQRFPKLFFWMQMMCQAFLNRGIPIHQILKIG